MVLRKESRIFVKTGFTDRRRQINGLSAMVGELRPEGPFDGAYYLFCGKTRKNLKILYSQWGLIPKNPSAGEPWGG
jgi:hypothetical protein